MQIPQMQRSTARLKYALGSDRDEIRWDRSNMKGINRIIRRIYLRNILSDEEGAVRHQRGIFRFSRGSAVSL
jgi:hypothetical protein